MKYKVLIFLILCLGCGNLCVLGQIKKKSQSSFIQAVSLRKIGKYAGNSPDKTLKISNVVFEDIRGFDNHWAHLFQLYDSRTKFRRGAKTENEHPCCIQEFSIFADEEIGISLLKQKDEWINKNVNVFIQVTDRGLTPFMNIGLVVRVELLNERGKVTKTLPEN